jgi:putative FmdB family regulatory protein
MPIYEYECLKCGRRTELLQRLDEAPLAACPECGGEVKKLISPPAFQFKGSGWYVTDYAGKKGGGAEAKSEGKSDDGPKADKTADKADKKEAAAESKGSSGSKSGSSGGSD